MILRLVVGPAVRALDAPGVSSELSSAGYDVEVVLSNEARHFVGPSAFAPRVVESLTELSERPEAVIFAPATAGEISRLAHGLSPFEETASLAAEAPVFVFPDLDPQTAKHPAVRKNIETLKNDGISVVEGEASGMVSAREVLAAVLGGFGGPMEGQRVLVTAGGTRERIDSVRFIGNRSSGRMGLAVARQAHRMGASVAVVAANVVEREPGVGWVSVESVAEMKREVMERVPEADVLIMAAAVSDFTPARETEGKIRRGGDEKLTLELTSTPDILAGVRSGNPDLFVVGFAATHGDPIPDAREKLHKKGADLIVGNDISRAGIGFESEENEVSVVGRDVEERVPRASKDEVARYILDASLREMSDSDKESRKYIWPRRP